jgi:hypothetical protein
MLRRRNRKRKTQKSQRTALGLRRPRRGFKRTKKNRIFRPRQKTRKIKRQMGRSRRKKKIRRLRKKRNRRAWNRRYGRRRARMQRKKRKRIRKKLRRSVSRKRRRKYKPSKLSQKSISLGVELETYSISVPSFRITRELQFPRRGAREVGERFTKDVSIGSEYNSKVFYTLREALFLLKNGLRKYIHYRPSSDEHEYRTLFPVGGWIDRFAGSHIHLALGKRKFDFLRAKSLSKRLHDHIPFIIAITGNSPVWREQVSQISSNRLLRGTKTYCQITKRNIFSKYRYREITYNSKMRTKPATLELRICDAGVPEYILAAACVAKAVAMRWLQKKPSFNQLKHEQYLESRDQAIRFGPNAKLYWNHHMLTVPQYVDLFFRKYEEELGQLDIPSEIIYVFKYLKKGYNQASVIRRSVQKSRWRHKPTWERRFAKKYETAIYDLLNGNSYVEFAKRLGVRLPSIDRVWLGRKEAKW